jgi:hypothetical protein
VTTEERAAADARFRARLAEQPPPDETTITRIAALFAAIRLRIARDDARSFSPGPADNLRPATKPAPPVSHPDHGRGNVRPSEPVSGVGN